MKKKIIVILSIIIAVFLILCAVAAFYAVPFVKSNECIIFANRNVISEDMGNDWISGSDIKALHIVDDAYIKDGIYIALNTKVSISDFSWNKISLVYDITTTVKEWDSFEKIESFNQKREIVYYFSDFTWKVERVNIM